MVVHKNTADADILLKMKNLVNRLETEMSFEIRKNVSEYSKDVIKNKTI